MYDRNEHIIGHGKELSYSSTAEGEYVRVEGTIEVNLPERELGTSEITNDSTPLFHKDYLPALKEPGTVGFTYRYARSQYAALEEIYQLADEVETRADATMYWKLTLPDGSVGAFRGFLTKHDLPVEGEDSPEVEGEIQVIGRLTFTPGSGS